MSKTTEQKLLEGVAAYLPTFLKYGNIAPFTKKIDTTLDIRDVEKLLRIHFLLRDDVVAFVEQVPERIRSIKTTTRKENEEQEERIRGRIDWQRTLKARYAQCDRQAYYVERTERTYATPANLVLYELIGTICAIIDDDVAPALENRYPWFGSWTQGRLPEAIRSLYMKNIYLRRIGIEKRAEVTDRMITDTVKARNPLYRDAALLLASYRRLMDYELDPWEAKELLEKTFVKPERTEVLFELYWTIQVIKAMTRDKGKAVFHIIDGSTSIVAEWEDETHRYRLYHDSVGPFTFRERWADIELPEKDGYLRREGAVVGKWQELCDAYFGTDQSDVLWGGRPDILVEQRPLGTSATSRILIGEVKYTESPSYAAQGLKELLDYVALIKKGPTGNARYVEKDVDALFSSRVIGGWLFLDKVNYQPHRDSAISVIGIDNEDVEDMILNVASRLPMQ